MPNPKNQLPSELDGRRRTLDREMPLEGKYRPEAEWVDGKKPFQRDLIWHEGRDFGGMGGLDSRMGTADLPNRVRIPDAGGTGGMDSRMDAQSAAEIGDFGEDGVEDSILDEIIAYAEGKDAEGLKARYAPPAPVVDEPIPGVEAEVPAEGGEEISPEDLERLLAQ